MSDGATDHTLSEKYESLDYEIVENELYRAEERDSEHQVTLFFKFIILVIRGHFSFKQKLFRQTIDRWIVCFLIGVCTAAVAAFIDVLVYYNSKLKFHLIINNCAILFELLFTGNIIYLFSNLCV